MQNWLWLECLALCCVVCSGCAQFDQYVARSVAAERAESRRGVTAAVPGSHYQIRQINACEFERCLGSICVHGILDADMDGSAAAACGGPDCRDNDPTVSPNMPEVCDGLDNNCDGAIDENCVSGE